MPCFFCYTEKNKSARRRKKAVGMDSIIIGIAGGTGSGKTTLTRRLKERFGQDVSVISHDNYYKISATTSCPMKSGAG